MVSPSVVRYAHAIVSWFVIRYMTPSLISSPKHAQREIVCFATQTGLRSNLFFPGFADARPI
jgi:hypothetical protein